jgi:N-acetylglucosamine-6-phosphate deacetylase
LKTYLESGRNGEDGCLIKGGLAEGTFINPAMCGAQNPAYVLAPDINKFDKIDEAGVIKLVNVVPDYGEKSCRLIKNLTKRGIITAAGHTRATAGQFKAAIDSGLRYVIHFLNGPTGGSYKPFNGGGAVEGILRDDRIYVELIADGFHVNPAYMRDVMERKGLEKVIVVTDAMFASQSKGVTRFKSGGIAGRLSNDGKYVYVEGKKPITLFGSVLTMDAAFSNILSLLTREMAGVWHRRHEAMSLETALLATARMCATNACDMLKMSKAEDPETGSIEEGKWADLAIADIKGRPANYRLYLKKVFVRGREVYQKLS